MAIIFDFELEVPVVVAFGALLVAALLADLAPLELFPASDVVSKVRYVLCGPRSRGGDRRRPRASIGISG